MVSICIIIVLIKKCYEKRLHFTLLKTLLQNAIKVLPIFTERKLEKKSGMPETIMIIGKFYQLYLSYLSIIFRETV